MKKLVITICVFVICLLCILLIPKDKNKQYKNLSKQEKIKSLININDLSDEFMNNYYNDYAIMASQDNLENVLIVISEKGIKNSYGATNIVNAPNHQYFLQYETEKEKNNAYEKLNNDGYLSVEENEIIQISEGDSTSREYMSWGISAMGLDYAIDEANKNINNLENVTVAVIDTGLDVDLFKNSFSQSKLAGTYNSMNNSVDVPDTNTHGTHVSGIVADGTPDNVKIFAVKAGDSSFMFTSLVTALNYITNNNNADVINMSLAGYSNDNSMYQAINAAKENNIIVVCGAGNNDTSQQAYPASYDNTISVASIDSEKNKSGFSNHGLTIDFTAPGTDINSINGLKSGTSMATPHISAAVAIVKSYNRNLSFNQVIDVLKTTTDDLGNYGWDQYYGNGMINFRNQEFCDGDICDKYNVFKAEEVEIEEVVKIESGGIYVPKYNYGNITNIMGAKIRIYYNDTEYVTKSLGELDDIEITGYDATSYSTQNVTINYKNKVATLEVNNENNTQSGWVYEIINDNSIKITGFLYDEEILKVYVPNKIDNYNVTTLGDNLFENNTFIKYISVSSNTNNVGNSTFKNTKLEKIVFKSNVINVGNYAFYEAKDLKKVDGVINSLGEYAFANCHSLDNVVLSDNLKRIENYAFANDQFLESINIPSTLTYIGEYAFSKTRVSSVVIPSGVLSINEGAFNECYNLSNLVISDGVKTIGAHAFQDTVLYSLKIPKSVEMIASTSFSDISSLAIITVNNENNYYEGINNLLIEKATNKLVVGAIIYDGSNFTANIPSTVKTIGERAFAKKHELVTLKIPEGVTKIEDSAFYYCKNFTTLEIPKSVTSIESNAFDFAYKNLLGKIYYESPARELFNTLNRRYVTIDPFEVNVIQNKTEYNAFETVDEDNLSLELKYVDKEKDQSPTVRLETINSNYAIKYNGDNDSFRYGDTYYTIEATTATGYKLSHNVEVTVSKIKPNYEVPSNIKGTYGQKLSSIILPSGFEWMNPNEIISNSGVQTFKARYIPNDTNNYEIVENVDITVSVGKQVINPEIIINDKIYDGTNNIDNNLISISNMESLDYTVISASITNSNVGSKDAKVVIRLSDEKYLNYSFENNTQEKEFTVNMNVIPEVLLKPVLENIEYVYNGSEQEVSIINYDSSKMNISGNTRTNAGIQKITISLKNNNYIWEDGTSEDIKYDFIINKANINLADNSKDVEIAYDGNNHTIDYNIESSLNTSVKYMNTNGEYTLSEIPKYKDVGSYVVKYKVSVNDNYNDYYNEKSITIITGEIINNTVDYEGYFDNNEHTLDIKTNVSDYDIKYSNNADYNLTEIPKYKDIGEYTINYKITKLGYNDLIGSNRVRIYGIRGFDSSVKVKNELLITSDFTFDELISKTDIYANTINYEHYNKNSELISDSGIKTKDKIKIILNNDKPFVYSIVLLGDTDGDGEINYLDYVNVYNHIQKVKHPESNKKLLENEYLQAADMSLDDEIDYMDYVGIYNRIKELKGGEQ